MAISSVTPGSRPVYQPPVNDMNAIKQLEKKKEQLQEQIQKLSERKMDEKAKQEQVKMLQEQIQLIDAEIRQRQADKLNPQQNGEEVSAGSATPAVSQQKEASDGTGDAFAGMNDLMQASVSFQQAKMLNGIRNEKHSQKIILTSQIKRDEGNSPSGAISSAKRKEVAEIAITEKVLDRQAAAANAESMAHVKDAASAEKPAGEAAAEPVAEAGAGETVVHAAETTGQDALRANAPQNEPGGVAVTETSPEARSMEDREAQKSREANVQQGRRYRKIDVRL